MFFSVKKLKPCPFCGAKATLIANQDKVPCTFSIKLKHEDWCVMANLCLNDYRESERAIKAWDTRADVKS